MSWSIVYEVKGNTRKIVKVVKQDLLSDEDKNFENIPDFEYKMVCHVYSVADDATYAIPDGEYFVTNADGLSDLIRSLNNDSIVEIHRWNESGVADASNLLVAV